MGKTINDPKWGSVYQREFRGVAWDEKLEQDLRSAIAAGDMLDFKHEGEYLFVVRQRVESESLGTFFKEGESIQRLTYSREVFGGLVEQLGDRGHGAVHPDNLFRVENGLVLLDWVANAARLQTVPESAATYDLWLWQPRIPPGWKAGDWDRVNLLRMAALLDKGPSSWKEPLPFPDMVQLCRSWAEGFIRALTAGDALERKLREALRLMDTIQPSQPAPPPRPLPSPPPPELEQLARLEEHLSTLLRQRGDRILRPEDEKKLHQKYGQDSSVLLTVALRLHHAERLEDVLKTAKAFLDVGVYEKSRSVRSSACRNAERLFQELGMPRGESERLVRELLASQGLKDSRALQSEWAPDVEQYLRQHCGRQRRYTRRQLSKMVKLVVKFDLPDEWAKLQLRQYLEQNSASMKRSPLGI